MCRQHPHLSDTQSLSVQIMKLELNVLFNAFIVQQNGVAVAGPKASTPPGAADFGAAVHIFSARLMPIPALKHAITNTTVYCGHSWPVVLEAGALAEAQGAVMRVGEAAAPPALVDRSTGARAPWLVPVIASVLTGAHLYQCLLDAM